MSKSFSFSVEVLEEGFLRQTMILKKNFHEIIVDRYGKMIHCAHIEGTQINFIITVSFIF